MDKKMNEIMLRRKNKVVLNASNGNLNDSQIASLLSNVHQLGYTFSKNLIECISTLSLAQVESFYTSLVGDIKKMTGAHRKFSPMYPNFPTQVMEASDAELYINAIMHYLGDVIGTRIMPVYEKDERLPLMDYTKYKVIDLATEEDVIALAKSLMGAKTSVSQTDKEDIESFIKHYSKSISRILPKEMPHKENLTFVASKLLAYTGDISKVTPFFKTATDVLRFAVALSNGDVSLVEKTKFRNFKRPERRMLLTLLENSGSRDNITEDMLRNKSTWIRLGEKLHPAEYTNIVPNAASAFSALRNKKTFRTFNSKVETALSLSKISDAVDLLVTRPGDMARRLDHLLRESSDAMSVVAQFIHVADRVSTPVLLQVMAHFDHRNDSNPLRAIFPKGNVAKVVAIENELPEIDYDVCQAIVNACKNTLIARFSSLESLGKVYVDPSLKNYLVPFSQRSASKSLRTLVRGSRIPFPEGNTIRFFIWWKNMTPDARSGRVDIDLSAIMYDKDWKYKEHISYTNLRSSAYRAAHSGDITSAPNGACEFIDIDIDSFINYGGRYVIMNVYSFSQYPFVDLPECFAGWMMRQHPKSGEIFDARTVQDKVDLTADTTICIPVILDLVNREAIWTDIALKNHPNYSVNIENNEKGVQLMGKALTTLAKANLHDLFMLHAKGRATEIVTTPEEADVIFSPNAGITPFDMEDIMSKYL